MEFKKYKVKTVEAFQWDGVYNEIVTQYRAQNQFECGNCGNFSFQHGQVESNYGYSLVCEGAWIVKTGSYYYG